MTSHARAIEIELLVLNAQAGDPEALTQLAHRYNDTLRRKAIALTNNPDAASDITQDTWVAIARNIRSLRSPSGFHAWASSILANKSRDWIRQQIKQRHRAPRNTTTPNETHASPDDTNSLRHAILVLDPKLRDIIILVHMDRCTIEQAADALAIPIGTAKSRLRKAKSILRQQLDPERT